MALNNGSYRHKHSWLLSRNLVSFKYSAAYFLFILPVNVQHTDFSSLDVTERDTQQFDETNGVTKAPMTSTHALVIPQVSRPPFALICMKRFNQ
jgi:hypothetical protein